MRAHDTGTGTAPRVSVVMPTYQRAAVVDRCLGALLQQTAPPHQFEVLVADDGSSDHTRQVAAQWAARSLAQEGPAIRYLHQQNAGANAARNRAIRAARGSILLFINDDTIPTPAMLAEHAATHDRYADDRVAVLGRVTIAPELPPSRLAPLHLDRAFQSIGNRRELNWRYFFTCNVSVQRSLLDRNELFEEDMRYHEDLELAERLSHLGLRVIYNPAALGYHYHHLTEVEFLGVARREARSLVVWFRKSPHLRPLLAEFGFEPALPVSAKWKNQLRDLVVNPITVPLWSLLARHCPAALGGAARRIYLQMYQSAKRRHLLVELRAAAPGRGRIQA